MLQTTFHPAWPHFIGLFFVLLGLFIGGARVVIHGWLDFSHCNDLLNVGGWLDSQYMNWQPEGCMLHSYKESEAFKCLQAKPVIFIGDSVTRKLFFQIANLLDASLPKTPPDPTKKHIDHSFQTKYKTNVTFIWDPFLNSSYTHKALTQSATSRESDVPAMVVLGSGLWYLRYANTSGGIPAWESNMDTVFGYLSKNAYVADNVVVLPVEHIVPSKLSNDRAVTMHTSDIDAMNSDLYHRINPLSTTLRPFSRPDTASSYVSLPLVFNKMLHESLTDDGIHYSDLVVKTQAQILLNLHCNDALPKLYPFDKTCCYRYPWPSIPHAIALALIILSGPYVVYKSFPSAFSSPGNVISALSSSSALPPVIISGSIALIYLADRTGFWLKEQKQFDPVNFGTVCLIFLVAGLATLHRNDTDLGFLNRDQTDEWKGWMQIVILIYHYFGASKISGIYNPVRVLVASYLFMTGYGHTMFYLRKADFGFTRVAQVLIRLNFYTIMLAYAMNTDYISYYFTPLVTMWYMIIYATFAVGARFNDRIVFVLCKILLSGAAVSWFMNQSWLLEAVFNVLHRFCAIHWSSKEWAFRVNLDIWIVYIGMIVAIVVIKAREYRFTDHSLWTRGHKILTAFAALITIWFFSFELYQESKFTYNLWHPYISLLPILGFVILRNSTTVMRSVHSRLFAFIGKCSLETFIIQFHFWLAGDSKGVLLVIPGTRWRAINFILITAMFTFISDRAAFATGEITNQICAPAPAPAASQHMPLPVTTHLSNNPVEEEDDDDEEGQEILMDSLRPEDANKSERSGLPLEPDTPIRPRRWIDRLADASPPQSQSRLRLRLRERGLNFGLKSTVGAFMVVLWLFNIFWVYPSDAPR